MSSAPRAGDARVLLFTRHSRAWVVCRQDAAGWCDSNSTPVSPLCWSPI